MKHPFDLPEEGSEQESTQLNESVSRRRALIAALAGVGGLAAGTASAQRFTTQALGEEGGPKPSTKKLGEEGGPGPAVEATTLAVGEEGGPRPTTLAVGEEGGGDKDMAAQIVQMAAKVTDSLASGNLDAAYETYAEAKKKAGGGLATLLANATIQIEAVANFEIGRALAAEDKKAAGETLAKIAAMELLAASRRASKHLPK